MPFESAETHKLDSDTHARIRKIIDAVQSEYGSKLTITETSDEFLIDRKDGTITHVTKLPNIEVKALDRQKEKTESIPIETFLEAEIRFPDIESIHDRIAMLRELKEEKPKRVLGKN